MAGYGLLDILIGLAPALAMLGWNVWLHKDRVRKAELKKQDGRMDGIEQKLDAHIDKGRESRNELRDRLRLVETRLENMPDKESVHQLALGQERMSGDIKTHGAQLTAVAASVKRVEEYLLKTGGK